MNVNFHTHPDSPLNVSIDSRTLGPNRHIVTFTQGGDLSKLITLYITTAELAELYEDIHYALYDVALDEEYGALDDANDAVLGGGAF